MKFKKILFSFKAIDFFLIFYRLLIDTSPRDLSIMTLVRPMQTAKFFFSVRRPPSGCLQWLFDREGTFQTFNFASGNGHLVNQDYSVCIRQETGKIISHFYCAICMLRAGLEIRWGEPCLR